MRWVALTIAALIGAAVIGLAGIAVFAITAWPKLPSIELLSEYKPKLPLRIFTTDGQLLAEYGQERRSFVPIANVPETLKQAILAAEDERFYEHPGVDTLGIARAAVANLVSGGRSQGASTITMQVARNFFLSREKTLSRKFYEILLSLKIENNLTKDQILEVYLNQIYLGQRSYGFSTAAKTYFGKTLQDLSISEAAMLAGLPKAPSAYNPVVNPKRAKLRQSYVLRRMHELGSITDAEFEASLAAPVVLADSAEASGSALELSSVPGAYVAEMARRIAVEQFGERAYELGIRVTTTISSTDQQAAYDALRGGVLDYDRRHGYRGPEAFFDLTGIDSEQDERLDEALAEHPDFGDLLAALVLEASSKRVLVYRRGETIELTGKGLRFAAPMLSERAPNAKRVKPGAIVRIRQLEAGWELLQLPEVEAALVSMDPATGRIRALVGGFDYELSKFNHVTQGHRQPGSSFKPFIFSASLEKGYSPASMLDDEPLSYTAGVTGSKDWEPKNYDNKYDGPMSLREALARSKNMVAIRLLESIGPPYAQDFATRFGFERDRHPPYLTLALGSGSASVWEMAAAYSVFANGGYRVEPYIVEEIRDNEGNVLARVDPPEAARSAARVLDPRNAYLMDSMLRDVVRKGTATRARSLGRSDLAGKTGTTNDYVDAWFCGYAPKLVAVAWVGFDKPKNLGRGETGGRAALPIWIDYMRVALEDVPVTRLEMPDGLVSIRPFGADSDELIYKENMPPPMPELPDMPNNDTMHLGDDPFFRFGPEPSSPAPQRTPAPVREAPIRILP
ncbi:MAG: penicillin-binding protein 1A [Rhodocyclaceae bacterium]|nr:penicillin-binding protein 1A [Rhodocyclaceae bacterium]